MVVAVRLSRVGRLSRPRRFARDLEGGPRLGPGIGSRRGGRLLERRAGRVRLNSEARSIGPLLLFNTTSLLTMAVIERKHVAILPSSEPRTFSRSCCPALVAEPAPRLDACPSPVPPAPLAVPLASMSAPPQFLRLPHPRTCKPVH